MKHVILTTPSSLLTIELAFFCFYTIDRCLQCVQGTLNHIPAITKSFPFFSAQIRTASQRHPTPLTPSPAPAQVQRCREQGLLAPKDIFYERICLFHPKGAGAFTPSEGDAGKFTSTLFGVFPLPFFPSLLFSLCSLSVLAAAH